MRSEPQPGVLRVSIRIAEFPGGSPHLIASHTERDDAVFYIAGRQFRDLHHMIGAELPDGIEIPPDFDRPLLLRFDLSLPDGPPDFIEVMSNPLDHPRAERDFRIANALVQELPSCAG